LVAATVTARGGEVEEESDRPAPVPIWTDAMRRMRELAAQMTAAAQAVAVAGARATPPALAQPLAGYTNQLLAVSAAVTIPLRRLLDEQERLVEKTARIDALAVQLLQHLHQVEQRSAQPIDAPGCDQIELLAGDGLQQLVEPWALIPAPGAGNALVLEQGDYMPAVTLGNGLQIDLLVLDALMIRADPDIKGNPLNSLRVHGVCSPVGDAVP